MLAEAMGRRLIAPGLAICFLAVCAILASLQFAASDVSNVLILVTGATVGGYLAITIGANDVANNVGPAVGARVVSITTALIHRCDLRKCWRVVGRW
jgi:PiT family inorganic phosphate transporter